jgi:putative polyhydroxyalkanoate system protein
MPKIQIVQDHSVAPEEARRRLETFNTDLRERYGLEPVWTSPTQVQISRAGASGTLKIEPRQIHVTIDLPLAFTMLRSRIEERIKRELGYLFAA